MKGKVKITFTSKKTKQIIINGESISIDALNEKKVLAIKKAEEIVSRKLALDEKYFFNFIKDELEKLIENHISTKEIQQWIIDSYDINIPNNMLEPYLS